MRLAVLGTRGKKSELQVLDAVFGVKPNEQLLAQAVRVYLSNQRQGTHKVQTRSEVNRTKKKWYRQKGTGNARHGSRNPNIFVGGGVAHGPAGLTDWSRRLSQAQRKKSLIYALSSKASQILVSSEVENIEAKTAKAFGFFQTVVPEFKDKRILVVLHKSIEEVLRSTQNIQNVLVTQAARVNVYELLLADVIVMTPDAVRAIEQRANGQEAAADEKLVKSETVKKPTKPVEAKTTKAVKPVKQEKPATTKSAKSAKPEKKTEKKAAKSTVKKEK